MKLRRSFTCATLHAQPLFAYGKGQTKSYCTAPFPPNPDLNQECLCKDTGTTQREVYLQPAVWQGSVTAKPARPAPSASNGAA